MLLATTHLADWGVFLVASVIVLAGGIGVVVASHPVHNALFLIQTLFGVAVLFLAQDAHFLAAVQVIVYAGAIVVLFLFVIMFLGVDRSEDVRSERLRGQRPTAVLLAVLGLAETVGLLNNGRWATGSTSVTGAVNNTGGSNVELLGRSLFSTYLLPFEVTSALLVIAVVGAVVLTKKPLPGEAHQVDEVEPDEAEDQVDADAEVDA